MPGRAGGWNRGLKLPVQYLVVSEKVLGQLQSRSIESLRGAVQLCRDLTIEGRGTHVVLKVAKTLSIDDVVRPAKLTDRDKYPWKQLQVGASFVYPGAYTAATVACKNARVRLRPKVFRAFIDECGDTYERKQRVVVKRVA